MRRAGVESRGVLPEVERFLGRIDAVPGRAVQVEVDVDAVLPALFQGLVEVLELHFVHLEPTSRVRI